MEKAFQFYIVDAVGGHVGRENAVIKSFAITATGPKEAVAVCRDIPRVKHHFKFAIQKVRKVSLEQYLIQRTWNAFDPYLTATNIQEQNCIEEDLPLISMEALGKKEPYKKTRKVSPKRYLNNYLQLWSLQEDEDYMAL